MGRRSPDAARSSATAPKTANRDAADWNTAPEDSGQGRSGQSYGRLGCGRHRGPDRTGPFSAEEASPSGHGNRTAANRTAERRRVSRRRSARANERTWAIPMFVRSLVRAAHRRSVGSPAAFLKNPRPQEYRRTPRRRRRREKNGLSCCSKPAITKRDASARQHVPRRPMLN